MGGMSGGKGGSAPNTPDFARAAEAQTQSGRINQSNPFGSTSWNGNTQTTSLAPGLAQGAQGLMDTIANQNPGDIATARQQAIDANYSQSASRLGPQWAQREESTRAQLANQGLDPGSQAYGNEMGNLGRERNDAYTSAMNNAIGQGNQTQMTQLAQANLPYQQLGMLQGLTQGLSGQGAQTQYLPAAMAAYQGDLQKYGIQQYGKNSALSGLSQAGGNVAMLAAL